MFKRVHFWRKSRTERVCVRRYPGGFSMVEAHRTKKREFKQKDWMVVKGRNVADEDDDGV